MQVNVNVWSAGNVILTKMLTLIQLLLAFGAVAAPGISIWGAVAPARPKSESGVGFWEGQRAPPHQLAGLGERCKLPSGVWGGSPAAKRFVTI